MRLPVLLRTVVGASMEPNLRQGQIIVGWRRFRRLRPGTIIIAVHDGLEKIKRLHKIEGDKVYVLGDNATESTDSRSFGWLPLSAVQAKVIWPRNTNPDRQSNSRRM